MNKRNFLKTASILALTGGLLLGTASAQRGGVGHAIEGVERATDTLFNAYKRELIDRGLWKPRGAYSALYSAIFRMEDYGDTLKKYYGKRANYEALLRVADRIDHQVHLAEDAMRHARVSTHVRRLVANVSRATHHLTGSCGASYGDDRRDRGYAPRYDERRYPRRYEAPRRRPSVERRAPGITFGIRNGSIYNGYRDGRYRNF